MSSTQMESPSADSELLIQIQNYLTHRQHGWPPSRDLETVWSLFYERYSRTIRSFAFACGVTDEEVVDCVQEVWRELLVRLPLFQLDPGRGQFDTWLYSIVQSKTADLHRSRKRRLVQGGANQLLTVSDNRPHPGQGLEEEEVVALAWEQLRKRLSECTFQVLQLRLMEQRPVAEVAEKLGLSHKQVWYRFHRARRELEEIGSGLARGQRTPCPHDDSPQEKKEKSQQAAQGQLASSVSRIVSPRSLTGS